jgi:hypothetical protein
MMLAQGGGVNFAVRTLVGALASIAPEQSSLVFVRR